MKLVFQTLCVALFLVSCQKTITTDNDVITAVVASNDNSSLISHSLTFTSDYPVKPGEVPPFTFTKTLYPDHRVRTIRMLSRQNPIYPGFAKQAVELIGTFTYASNTSNEPNPGNLPSPHLAYLKGTSEVWEYYKTSTGAGARRSVSKRNINYKIYLSPLGFCNQVVDLDQSAPGEYHYLLLAEYVKGHGYELFSLVIDNQYYYAVRDQFGDLISFTFPSVNPPDSYFRIAYDYSSPVGSKNFSYIPSQNLISQEYSLMEVMQWTPPAIFARKSAGGTFKLNGQWVNQDQVYKNYKFDANGNQTSLTYGDNVLQKTTWDFQH